MSCTSLEGKQSPPSGGDHSILRSLVSGDNGSPSTPASGSPEGSLSLQMASHSLSQAGTAYNISSADVVGKPIVNNNGQLPACAIAVGQSPVNCAKVEFQPNPANHSDSAHRVNSGVVQRNPSIGDMLDPGVQRRLPNQPTSVKRQLNDDEPYCNDFADFRGGVIKKQRTYDEEIRS